MFTKNLYVMIGIAFCFGFLTSIRSEVGYCYIMEMIPSKNRVALTTFWSVQEVWIYLMASIYFWKISKDWFWFTFIGYCWNIISFVCLFSCQNLRVFLLRLVNGRKLAKLLKRSQNGMVDDLIGTKIVSRKVKR